MQHLKYLSAYSATLQDKVRRLIAEGRLGTYLEARDRIATWWNRTGRGTCTAAN